MCADQLLPTMLSNLESCSNVLPVRNLISQRWLQQVPALLRYTLYSIQQSYLLSDYGHDAGLHPLRQAAKKERMIDEHRLECTEQYISYRPCAHRLTVV
jgi:hypothetical protein